MRVNSIFLSELIIRNVVIIGEGTIETKDVDTYNTVKGVPKR